MMPTAKFFTGIIGSWDGSSFSPCIKFRMLAKKLNFGVIRQEQCFLHLPRLICLLVLYQRAFFLTVFHKHSECCFLFFVTLGDLQCSLIPLTLQTGVPLFTISVTFQGDWLYWNLFTGIRVNERPHFSRLSHKIPTNIHSRLRFGYFWLPPVTSNNLLLFEGHVFTNDTSKTV